MLSGGRVTGRRIALLVIAVVALGAALVYAYRADLALALIERVADRRFAARPLEALEDGLHVGLCGAGAPLQDDRRGGPCTVVIAGKRMFVVDAGSGAARNLTRMGFNPGDIEALFLTHFHSDHVDGLGEIMLQRWAAGARTAPLPVHGPTGVADVIAGFMQAYSHDRTYRIAHHGAKVVPSTGFGGEARSFEIAGTDGRAVLVDEPDLQIVAFGVEHAPVKPAAGYRIRYKNREVVISGDTSKTQAVQREARGVDLLVHEALSERLVGILERSAAKAERDNLAHVFHDIPGYHTTPEQVAEIARDAKVGFLLFHHIVPGLPPIPGAEAAFLGNAGRIFDGRMHLGIDGDFVSMPAGSDTIELSNTN
jgi:ribonuclease Z